MKLAKNVRSCLFKGGCLQDIGCCLGQDTRQLILDGIPQSSIRATDITPQYW